MFGSAVLERVASPAPGPDSARWLAQFSVEGADLRALTDALSVSQRHQAWVAAQDAQLLAAINAVEATERAADLAAGESPLSAPGWGYAIGAARDRHWVSEEVALILRICGASARDRMAEADTLVRQLPSTVALLEAGDLHPAQARRFVEAVLPLSGEQCRQVEKRVLRRAPEQSISAFCRCLRRAVAAVAPRTAEADHVAAMAERRVVVTPAEGGMATLWALLPAPEALRIKAILDRAAHDALARQHHAHPAAPAALDADRCGGPAGTDGGDGAGARGEQLGEGGPEAAEGCGLAMAAGAWERFISTPGAVYPGPSAEQAARLVDQRRADALVELVECGAAAVLADADSNTDADSITDTAAPAESGEVPIDGPPGGKRKRKPRGPVGSAAPVIQVTVALSTLLGVDDQPGELAGYGPIPASMARRLAADRSGTWRRLVTDPLGRLIDYGRERYEPPPELAEFVRARDGVCAFPNCQRAAARCDLDHALDWELGGHTNEHNLGPLCPRHHHLKHDTDWTMDRDPDTGTTTWVSPSGHTYRSEPPDLPGPDAA